MIKDKSKIFLFFLLIFIALFSIYALGPQIRGDSLLYTSSIEVLETGIQPAGFVPMMISSTYLGLSLVRFFTFLFGSISAGWLFLNVVLYVIMSLSTFALFRRIFDSAKVAFLGTLFLATNYAVIVFGLAYMMDLGGWTAYIAALYFAYRYLEKEETEDKWLYLSALMVGLGGIYKEYAFVALLPIFGVVIFKNWKRWLGILWRFAVAGFLAFTPFVLLNLWTHFKFDYTYLDWFLYNHGAYDYQNRLVEFIKSFGSIYNFGWFLFLPGLYLLLKRWREALTDKKLFFIWLTILSCGAILLWPVVTRVLFITMPATVLVSSLFIKKLKHPLVIIMPILIIYMASSYLMDAFILNFVNIDPLLKLFE